MESMVQEEHDETSSFHIYPSRLIGLGWDEEQPSALLTTDLIETSNKSLCSKWLELSNKTSWKEDKIVCPRSGCQQLEMESRNCPTSSFS
ncbi:hypothetical protein E2P81_ATG05997 [Venturia nashicola]|nr:hypothetical protein E2P81_ATG05997 [Venturia nashicola]